jgi:hypothetical protein
MAGLVPAIHVFARRKKQDVDVRHKAGHDERHFCGANAQKRNTAVDNVMTAA